MVVRTPETTLQRIEIELPEGLVPAPAPPASFEGPLGSFSRTERAEGRSLVREERIDLRRGRVPPDRYPDLAAFAGAVDQVQQRAVLFQKGEVGAIAPGPPAGTPAPPTPRP